MKQKRVDMNAFDVNVNNSRRYIMILNDELELIETNEAVELTQEEMMAIAGGMKA
ncbi:hypothetical protein [Pantoea sp. BS_1]|uniref:hypothetical protein n=1 Tax=Pantoea sp. BS_1 TaxID=3055779 RepID=UPI003F81EEEB